VGNHFHRWKPPKQWVVVVVYYHTEVARHIDMAQQAQIMYHIQKNNLNQIYSMLVHILGAVSHNTVGKVEEVHWVTEMVAGGDWEDNSEKEHKVAPLDGDLVKVAFEVDFRMNVVAVVEIDEVRMNVVAVVEVDEVRMNEVMAESTEDEESADIVDAEVPLVEDVTAELKAVGIADFGFPEIEWVVVSMDLSEEQLGLGSERIDLEVDLEVANPVEEVH
jgi:hypothetical protein